ncbi:chorismate mutase [Pseudomonas sp. NPDC089752]|uniref:chorismate mutase n=1 Tax=Pseudomonas sp. NPDC089752 TaxID=3364472 RepID=UPI0037F73DB2
MRLIPITLCLSIGLVGCQTPHSSPSEFTPLLTSIEQRLNLASSVAVHKWDKHLPVESTRREAQVLSQAREMAPDHNLSPERAAAFFTDQIEANKIIQYTLLDRWTRMGYRPPATRMDLARDLRPHLDKLQVSLLKELSRFDQQQPEDCQRKLSHALAQRANDWLHHQALLRATLQLCTQQS